MVCGFVLLFLLDIEIENRFKSTFSVRLAGDHLYGKWLFTWLSLVLSLMVSYLCCPLSHELSWMKSGTELSQFLKIFIPTHIPQCFEVLFSHAVSRMRCGAKLS